MESTPKANRGNRGLFTKGNTAAKGRANAADHHIQRWRRAFTQYVKAGHVTKAMKQLTRAVDAGEPWAIKELLDRTLGKADQRLEITGEDGGPVATEITLKLQFADRSLLTPEPLPMLETDNGQRET